jgi:hypothetical protein
MQLPVLSGQSPNIQDMNFKQPRFSKFSAEVNGKVIYWSPRHPHLTGDPELIVKIHEELSKESHYPITPTGPSIERDSRNAAAVYIALMELFGETATFINPPNLDLLWLTPDMLDEFGNLRTDIVF